MQIYAQERGIADLILNNKSVACTVDVKLPELKGLKLVLAEHIERHKSADLYSVFSLLVSSVWNANDDVFTPSGLWLARHTPNDHPTNIGHVQTDIVGHITKTWVVDERLQIIGDNAAQEDLPKLIHLINESVIYIHYEDENRLQTVFNLIEEIESGKMSVSMEAHFSDFDYAICKVKDEDYTVVERNEKTAFLTKHLRAYGGTGVYHGYYVGRLLRDFVFVGKGFVNNPANEASIIFTDGLPFAAASSDKVVIPEETDAFHSLIGVQLDNETSENLNMLTEKLETELVAAEVEETKDLATELAEANNEIGSLKEELDACKAECSEISELIKLREELEAELASLKEVNVAQSQAIAELTETSEKVNAELEEAKTSLIKANEELETIAAEKKRAVRISSLASTNLTAEESAAFVDKFINLDDEQWETLAGALAVPQPTEVASEEVTLESAEATNHLNHNDDEEDEALKRLKNLQSSVSALLKKGAK